MTGFIQILLPVLYGLAMVVLFVYGCNLLALSRWHVRRLSLLGDRNEATVPHDVPRVTIQLPLYNEPLVVGRLLGAVSRMDWPAEKLQVQILDDSDDETPGEVGRHLHLFEDRGIDVLHVRRESREGYKAGALQAGLQSATGEFIAVFDADFIPSSDFLRRTVPAFEDPEVGMVQGRWGHVNAEDSILTRMQSFGLDTHFAIEQRERSAAGCFINFNGTAGIWRRRCIETSGGWEADTLTEDLDLSYRAQIAGWRFRYLHDLEVPAELPVSMNAFRAQQHRWTKGGLETARKLLGRLWRADLPARVKWEGTIHLTANGVFPFILVAALCHAPLVGLQSRGMGPGAGYFALMSVGLIGFAGFFLAQVHAQRSLYPDWGRRLRFFPAFLAGSIGMAVSNSRAVSDLIAGRPVPFARTPKFSVSPGSESRWWNMRYADLRIPPVAIAEAAMAIYCAAGLVLVVAERAWAAVPFQLLFMTGFLFVSMINIRQSRLRRTG
ncbi:MAG: glycosyltransferase [Rhodothermales bacterium]|nr:glycosyltransferase [Rhodothermales bacterium]